MIFRAKDSFYGEVQEKLKLSKEIEKVITPRNLERLWRDSSSMEESFDWVCMVMETTFEGDPEVERIEHRIKEDDSQELVFYVRSDRMRRAVMRTSQDLIWSVGRRWEIRNSGYISEGEVERSR